MIDLVQQLTALPSNQLLVAGIGTTIAAYAALQAKSFAGMLKGLVGSQTFSSLTARSNGATITRLSLLVAKHRLHAWGRAYSVAEDNELTIGYGSGIARWNGIWIWYNLRVDENAKVFHLVEVLRLTFFTRDRGVVERFVREALDASNQVRDTIEIHHRANNSWHAVARRKRPLATIFANGKTKTALVEKVRWFLDNEAWYVARGLPYKLVILLHGAPGTGKSSLIQAVASHFNRDLYCLDQLQSLGPDIGRFTNGILAIEDIDTLGMLKRVSSDGRPSLAGTHEVSGPSSAKVLLHGVLNTLDGLATPHGLITIITTNHLEALDPAMVRPCRIDWIVDVGPLEYEAFAEMFASYYNGAMPALIREVYVPQTGARLQELFMSGQDAAEAATALHAVCAAPREAA